VAITAGTRVTTKSEGGEALRIGVIGPVGPDYFADNVIDSLQGMGHTPIELGPGWKIYRSRLANGVASAAKRMLPVLDERSQRRISRAANEAACELIVNIDMTLLPSTVRRLQRAGARVVFWFPDHIAQLGRQLMLLAPYDALFFKDPILVERLRANLGLPAYYLPEACNPRWHRPLVPAGTEPYLVIAGSMYPSRVKLLQRLVAKGIPLKLYGGAFPPWLSDTSLRDLHTGRVVFREDKARVFRSAAGVLNNLHPAEAASNARLFEAAGSGAAVLTEFRPALPELFLIDHEVLAFRDFDELVDQASRLLGEAGLAARLGDAAAERAHRDHTYEARLATIITTVS
jgi:spore maturation protein CgeB